MPLYEYQCPTCGRFEVIRKFSDSPLTECPTCGKAITKLVSAPAIQFKGAGWYVTDYAKKPSNGEGAKSGESSASGSAKESTPASKEAASTSNSSKDQSAPSTTSSATSSASGSSPSK